MSAQRQPATAGDADASHTTTDAMPLVRCTGWLAVFLFALLGSTGILLSIYYVPSAAPATTSNGHELGTAKVWREVRWMGTQYRPGDYVALPLNRSGDTLEIPDAWNQSVTSVVDSSTDRIVRPSAAWHSVDRTITRGAELGAIIRSLHHYAASLFIAALALYLTGLFAHFFMRSARRPRERARMWCASVTLLLAALVAGYTGSILPWHSLAYAAARVGTSFAASTPMLGASIAEIVRGGGDVAQATLTRAHALHVVALPLLMVLLVAWIVLRLRRSNTAAIASTTTSERREWTLLVLSLVLMGAGAALDGKLSPDSALAAVGLVLFPVVVSALATRLVSPARDADVLEHAPAHDAANAPRSPLIEQVAVAPGDDGAIDPGGRVSTRSHRYSYLLAAVLLSAVLASIAIVAPWRPRGVNNFPVDLLTSVPAPATAQPEWYLYWGYGALSVLSTTAVFAILLCLVALAYALPLILGIVSARRAQRASLPNSSEL